MRSLPTALRMENQPQRMSAIPHLVSSDAVFDAVI